MRQRDLKFTFVVGEGKLAFDVVEFELEEALCEPFRQHKTSNWSAIWVLPLVALAIGAWLGWRAYDQAGVLIQVRFESSDGIQAKKTEVLYKGIAVGKVVALDVSEDIKGVVATIEMDKEARQYLSKGTRFWLVKPRVSLAGVTGLETLVSGVYIAVDPVKGEKEERASPSRPTCSPSTPPSKPRAPARPDAASRWSPTRCATWPTVPRSRPSRSRR